MITVATVAGVVVVLTLAALVGIIPAIRDPLGTYRRSRRGSMRPRWWSLLFIGAAVALFWLRSSNIFVTIAFTTVVILGWGLLSTGPWIIGAVGKLIARRARRPPALIAGRRLAGEPASAWRTVSGFSLASFLVGFIAACLPVGLGNVGDHAARADRLDAVVPATSLADTVRDARVVLRDADIQAVVEPTATPSWLDEGEWGTLTVTVDGPTSERDRARTAMIQNGLWGPEMRLAEDLPNAWLVLDGVVVGLLVLPIAALVALAAMTIGAIARIFEQRDTLIALRLAGTPTGTLVSAQRHELILPTAVAGGIATIAGLASGSTLGSVNLLNPYSAGILTVLIGIGASGLWIADRTTQPILERTSSDLSERE